MQEFQISAKDLGELALQNCCKRCFWIKRRIRKLPYQIFPGIFSSIDSYSKRITHGFYESQGELPKWLRDRLGGEPQDVPSHSAFCYIDRETRVKLTGVPDEIIKLTSGGYAIVDYKTARFTDTQDDLKPQYEAQLNAYAYIAENTSFNPVDSLWLLYYEPVTEITDKDLQELVDNDGFRMRFKPQLIQVSKNSGTVVDLLTKARRIVDSPGPPEPLKNCKDCAAVDEIVRLLAP